MSVSCSVVLLALGEVLRCAGPRAGVYPAGPGRARMALSRLVKVSAHGQRVGMRRVWRPERLTATAGMAVIRVRNVTLVTPGFRS